MAQLTEVTLPMLNDPGRRATSTVLAVMLVTGLLTLLAAQQQEPTGFSPPPLPEGKMAEVIQTAYGYLGTPHVFGPEWDTKMGTEMDTSGFVKAVLVKTGVWKADAARTAMEQVKVGRAVRGNELQPGDRLYFDFLRDWESGRRAAGVADHTGLYLGEGLFIHATPPRVRIDRLTGVYSRHLLAARRDQ